MFGKKENAYDSELPEPAVPHANDQRKVKSGAVATIGASIMIRGEVFGEENLVIQGKVEGNISLKKNDLIVGQQGRVHANIQAKTITVEGEVHGDMTASERVTIRKSARVMGNLLSPKVALEEGAVFRGSIDMEPPAASVTNLKKKEGAPAAKTAEASKSAPKSDASAHGSSAHNTSQGNKAEPNKKPAS